MAVASIPLRTEPGAARQRNAGTAVLAAALVAALTPPIAQACELELLLYVPIEHLVTLRVAVAPMAGRCANVHACDAGGRDAR